MTLSGVGLLVVLPGALFAAARPRRALHGDARFANTTEITRAGLSAARQRAEHPDRPAPRPVPVAAGPAVGDAVGAHPQRQGRRRRHPEPAELARLGRRARHQGRELRRHRRLPRSARPGGLCLLALRRRRAQPPLEPADRRALQPAAPRRRPADHRPGVLPQRWQRHLVGSLLQRPGAQPVPRPGPRPARNAGPAAHDRRDAAPVFGQGPVAEGPPERPDHAAPG